MACDVGTSGEEGEEGGGRCGEVAVEDALDDGGPGGAGECEGGEVVRGEMARDGEDELERERHRMSLHARATPYINCL